MSFSIEIPWLFLFIACFAGYFQTVTGFGLGMIVLGLAGGFGIVPLTSAVVVVSLMTMVNCAFALPGRLQHVYWPAVAATLLGLVPTIIVGVLLLNYLSDSASSIVHVLLGMVIVYGGVALLLKPRIQEEVARPASFTVFGGLSGFLGGLFEIAGPPLIYHYYRQPLNANYIRHTLLLLFAVSSGVRTLFVVGQGQMNMEILLLTAWAFPVVVAGTFLGRNYPPPLSAQTLRRLVFILLILIGVSLIASGLLD
ncbi:sulfite exporter TauE/SafE family protein [Pseudomonas sp. C27(2019)]|uniref:sulfite exporter TauE/SafE family protein n=1 Tax=Pseudomonas sp. C27(2019) TaxID=2604941 RepID=UPI001248304D|nr:sulfite exporter TauE/SafE family protein [Pseudomonas sp. C27(2019)]QEY60280.1 sulfite exporter TauE/SafE family protein [Pseudomonas sp. C27(2019)]